MAWHALISGPRSNRVGLRARNREQRKDGRAGAQAAERLLLHRQQQVSARATTVVSMSRMGDHGRQTKTA